VQVPVPGTCFISASDLKTDLGNLIAAERQAIDVHHYCRSMPLPPQNGKRAIFSVEVQLKAVCFC
jgi:hypothetical protein